MTTWIPNLPLFKLLPGFHLVTVHLWEDGRKPIGVTTSAAHYNGDGHWWEYADDDVIAWAEMPEPYDGKTPTDEWQYDEDTGGVMCRCPNCGGRLGIHVYLYRNPYKYCPYCGDRLNEGNITAKRREVYGGER